MFDRVVAAQGRGGSAGVCKCNILTSARPSHFRACCVSVCGMVPLGVSATSAVTSAGLSRGNVSPRGGRKSTSAVTSARGSHKPRESAHNTSETRETWPSGHQTADPFAKPHVNTLAAPPPPFAHHTSDHARVCRRVTRRTHPLPASRLRVSTIAKSAISATCAPIRSTRRSAH